MNDGQIVPSLFLVTLIAVAVIAIVMLIYFMRKRSNRHPMDSARGHEIDEMRRDEAEHSNDLIDRPPTR